MSCHRVRCCRAKIRWPVILLLNHSVISVKREIDVTERIRCQKALQEESCMEGLAIGKDNQSLCNVCKSLNRIQG